MSKILHYHSHKFIIFHSLNSFFFFWPVLFSFSLCAHFHCSVHSNTSILARYLHTYQNCSLWFTINHFVWSHSFLAWIDYQLKFTFENKMFSLRHIHPQIESIFLRLIENWCTLTVVAKKELIGSSCSIQQNDSCVSVA